MGRSQFESGWGTRLTNLRRNVDSDGEVTNKFGQRVTGRPKAAPAAPAQTRTLKTRQGTVESPELTAARLAEQKRKADLKEEATRPKYFEPSPLDTQAISESFIKRHSNPATEDYFYPSPWNNEQFARAMDHYTASGQVKWDSAGLDAIHHKLKVEGYYEPARRLRGQPAPKEVAPYVKPEPVETAPVQLNANVIDRDERARLKALPFEELARQVRRGYKVERPQ